MQAVLERVAYDWRISFSDGDVQSDQMLETNGLTTPGACGGLASVGRYDTLDSIARRLNHPIQIVSIGVRVFED